MSNNLEEPQDRREVCVYFGEILGVAAFVEINTELSSQVVECMASVGAFARRAPGGTLRVRCDSEGERLTVRASRPEVDMAAVVGGMKAATSLLASRRAGTVIELKWIGAQEYLTKILDIVLGSEPE